MQQRTALSTKKYNNYFLIKKFKNPQEVKIPGIKTKIKNKLEWLRVGNVLNWENLVKDD